MSRLIFVTNAFRSVVGTFLCGPAALAKVLQKKCAKYSDVDPRKTKFYFNMENFWAEEDGDVYLQDKLALIFSSFF